MKNIKVALWLMIGGLSALWLIANIPFPEKHNFIGVRNLLVQYSGVLSIGAMSVAMILATRARWVDRWLDGLDKSYRLHKWLGICALVTSVIHWLATQGPKWMVGLGLMDRPQRGGRHFGTPEFGAIHAFLNSQRGTAEMLGEWAFYAAVLLIGLALVMIASWVNRFGLRPISSMTEVVLKSRLRTSSPSATGRAKGCGPSIRRGTRLIGRLSITS